MFVHLLMQGLVQIRMTRLTVLKVRLNTLVTTFRGKMVGIWLRYIAMRVSLVLQPLKEKALIL